MVSVSRRVRTVPQPRGGYIKLSDFENTAMGTHRADPLELAVENIPASLVGITVDYLTRVATGTPAADAFKVSLWGAETLGPGPSRRAQELCEVVDGYRSREMRLPDAQSARFLVPNFGNPNWRSGGEAYCVPDSAAIEAATELVSFDVVHRAGAALYNPDAKTWPDAITVEHISVMLARSLTFMWAYGPIFVDGFTTLGGYTRTVDAGDGDFVTRDTLWDFKVSAKPPTREHTLQLLVYWLMARRSEWNWHPSWNWDHRMPEEQWREVWDLEQYLRTQRTWPDDLRGPMPTHIGIFNPRSNTVYRLAVSSIPAEVVEAVERDVIGYELEHQN